MSKFAASYQVRVGLRLREVERPEGVEAAEPPSVADIEVAIKAAVEVELPDYEASVEAERLDV